MEKNSVFTNLTNSINHTLQTILILGLTFTAHVSAHGEQTPGPHGGVIRMPGAFHMEVIQTSKKTISVYLLDIEWANPTIENSSIEAVFSNNQGEKKATCLTKTDRFECIVPPNINIKAGQLKITSSRKGLRGGVVIYNLPIEQPHK